MSIPATILIVGGSDPSRRRKSGLLGSAGFAVVEVVSGAEALNVATSRDPDLVLLDEHVQDVDGCEVCRRLRATDPTHAVPVIQVCAAGAGPAAWRRGLEAGADSCLEEPVDEQVLLAAVEALLRRRLLDAEARRARPTADLLLDDSSRRSRAVFENAPCGICWCAPDGRILSANLSFAAILAEPNPEALTGTSFARLFRERSEGEALVGCWARETCILGREAQWLRSNGEVAETLISVNHLAHEAGDTFLVFVDDTTSRRMLENEFRQAQKLESVGRLAGGIAHDFNNLLTAILGYCQMMREDLGIDHANLDDLGHIEGAAQMASSLTEQLLAFSRRQVLQTQTVSVSDVVGRLEPILSRLIGERIELEIRRGEDVPIVRADAAQLQQVVMNLVVNARDAMPRGGRITIETAHARREAHSARAARAAIPGDEGSYAMFAVSDTGTGISPDVMLHLFEPFFTTKGKGEGTGLGLATVYGIVTQMGGLVEVDPSPGRGATFRVLLPAAAPGDGSGTSASKQTVVGGSETVLIVEDEAAVRALAAKVLTRNGYRVLEAESPKAALQLALAHPGSIDLVLTDVIMPGMGVREMVSRLLLRAPSTRVLYMSGYTQTTIAKEGIIGGEVSLLRKPFSPVDLLSRVRELLDERSTVAQ